MLLYVFLFSLLANCPRCNRAFSKGGMPSCNHLSTLPPPRLSTLPFASALTAEELNRCTTFPPKSNSHWITLNTGNFEKYSCQFYREQRGILFSGFADMGLTNVIIMLSSSAHIDMPQNCFQHTIDRKRHSRVRKLHGPPTATKYCFSDHKQIQILQG